MSNKKYAKIFNDCMNELYLNAEPPISWMDYKLRYFNTEVGGFTRHLIDKKRYDTIIKKYRKKLTRIERRSLNWNVMNFGPTFSKSEDDKEKKKIIVKSKKEVKVILRSDSENQNR